MAGEQELVVDKALGKPSEICPMLFVGLGGCGCQMVDRIAKQLRRRPDYEERYKNLVKFALVDSNVNDLESYREIADETFLISDFEKEQYANLAAGKQFLEADDYFTQWVPPNYRFRAGDTSGAGQIRIEARLGVYYQMKHKDLVPRFRQLLEDLKSHELGMRRLDSSEIRIILCFSVAGGTGSGCHLPIAYLLRDQAKELGKPLVLGVAVLPSVFVDKTGINKDGTYANGYAALKEDEFLMKLGAPESRFFEAEITLHYDPSDTSKKTVRERPFEFLYIIDKPESFSVPEPVDAAADGLYLQFFSPLFDKQFSDYDNYTQHQRYLVPNDFEKKGIIGFSTFYGSYGAAVLTVPVAGLVGYCSRAAALSLMRSSFLGEIPGDPVYKRLRDHSEPFYEVTLREGQKHEKPVREAEFRRKERLEQEKLRDRLYMKRVRLLAACELGGRGERRFLTLFRHGHRLGEVPKLDGGFEHVEDRVAPDYQLLAEQGMRFSIGAIVLWAVAGERPGKEAGLLVKAGDEIDAWVAENVPSPGGDITVRELQNKAWGWMEDSRDQALTFLRDGYRDGTVSFPGLESLAELEFMKSEAGEVDLAAKRYAALRILEEVDWSLKAPDERTEIVAPGRGPDDKIKEKDAPPVYKQLTELAKDRAKEEVKAVFIDRLADFKRRLENWARTQRALEEGFGDLEREQAKKLERQRERGEAASEQYVLSAEALQAENGRRLWDFYYEDRVASLPELSLGDKRVQQRLSDTITDLSVAATDRGTTVKLEQLFEDLRLHAHDILRIRIGGDPYASDQEARDGLTLSDALEFEVVYRALYRSHAEDIKNQGAKEIQRVVAEYRSLPTEKRVDFADPKHRDYLHDKIKRVVNEKASLLCVYDEGRDQHGGVRPDNLFLAAIDANFKNSNIHKALTGANIEHLEWVSSNWHNSKEIIFYRAVLNVPLYVFGRLDQMRADYHAFKKLANRPRTLHIDRNWEDKLDDLDPNSAQEKHRQTQIRDQIINFAALYTSQHPGILPENVRCVLRREGEYFLVDPRINGQGLPYDDDKGLALLGATMGKAVQRLPEVLAEESVKYMDYQLMLNAVRRGLSPRLLADIAKLPFAWRQQRDELRTQYGSHPTPDQQERLKDHTDAYSRLQEALDSLLAELRNLEIESNTLGEDLSANAANLDGSLARQNLRQSIRILGTFSETWKKMEDPHRARNVPASFRDLFQPMEEDKLRGVLHSLTRDGSENDGSGEPPRAGAAAEEADEGRGDELQP